MTTVKLDNQLATFNEDGRWEGSPLLAEFLNELQDIAERTLIREARYEPDRGLWEATHAQRFLGAEAEVGYTPSEIEPNEGVNIPVY